MTALFFPPALFMPLLANAKGKAEQFLPSSLATASITLESTATMHMVSTLCKNLPFKESKGLKINDLYHFLSTRIGYLELSLLCVAGLVHNAMMGILHTGLAIATKGLDPRIQYSLQKHWHHSFHCTIGIGIGFSGIIFPYLGVLLTSFFLKFLWDGFVADWKRDFKRFEAPLLVEFKRALNENQGYITEFISAYLQDEYRYGRIYPLLENLTADLSEIQKFPELIELLKKTLEDCTNQI